MGGRCLEIKSPRDFFVADGRMHSEEAFAQSKMIESREWKGQLPRGIVPSDIDIVFDSQLGRLIFCEFSRDCCSWQDLKVGQRKLYESVIFKSKSVAALCSHNVPIKDKIQSSRCDQFSLMAWEHGIGFLVSGPWSGDSWMRFVKLWFQDPEHARQLILATSQNF